MKTSLALERRGDAWTELKLSDYAREHADELGKEIDLILEAQEEQDYGWFIR